MKLDLVLRAIALPPNRSGRRKPGFVLRDWASEDLYDLAAPPPRLRRERSDRTAAEERHLKRKWVADQLDKLAELKLVDVTSDPGRRSKIVVLRDDGSGRSFDDPAGKDELYLTIRGSVIASGHFATWGAPELAGYFAASIAAYYHPRGAGRGRSKPGTGTWWRQLSWFKDDQMDPKGHTVLPFAPSTIETGLAKHLASGLITKKKIRTDPVTNRRLVTERNLYTNHFDTLDKRVRRVPVESAPDGED